MNCNRCRKPLDDEESRCPHCGEPVADSNGLYQTSTVMISSGGSDLVYRSVDEVPARLRNKLQKFTNGRNSATILIADRRGRREIAKAMRNLPGPAVRRRGAAFPAWLTPQRKRIILAILILLIATFLTVVFRHSAL
jgi:hypothetical protein